MENCPGVQSLRNKIGLEGFYRVSGSHRIFELSIFRDGSHKSVLTNYAFLFLTIWEPHPSQKCENRSGSQIGYQVRTWEVLTERFSPPVKTFNPVLLTADVSGSHRADSHWEPGWKKSASAFSQWVGENHPTTLAETSENMSRERFKIVLSSNFDIHPWI